jgi:NADPH:quinone reductase-like Zn-dependent oxidoreductase
MRAFALADFDSTPTIQHLPIPEPGLGRVRIRVEAAALNGIDPFIAGGMLKSMAEYRFPLVIGGDAAGTVDALGEDVDRVAIGDEVLGHDFNATVDDLTHRDAEVVTLDS